ncbi:hypothetical protein BGZ74_000604, partial [Mortierella antarctica]
MHTIRGQPLPSTYLEHPHDPPTPKPNQKNKEEKEKEKAKEKAKEKEKEKEKEKAKKKAFTKDQERMVSTSLLTTTAFLGNMATPSSATTTTTSMSTSSSSTSVSASVPPSPSSPAYSSSLGRNRSSSSTSSLTVPSAGVIEGNRSRSSSNTSTLPSSLFRHKQSTGVDDKDKDHQQQQHQSHAAGFPQYHQQSHFYLQKRQPSNPSSLPPPLLPKHSSSSTSSSSSSIFRRKKHDPTPTSTATSTHIHSNHHSILMVPQHDIHITWPHPVPSGNIYIAGTWSVPGHGPWEKLAMTPVEGTDSLFEVHLNVNEIEDIADYLDDEGHIHHELTTEGHCLEEAAVKLSKRQRLRRFFGRAKGKNSKDGTTTPLPGQTHTHLPHDAFLPLTKEYRYQYKFVVDDQWMCDEDRPQVRDKEGHCNHELVVELIEQIQGSSSSSSDSVRSRSSSLHSVQSVNAHLSDAHPYQPPQAALPVDSSSISTTKPTPQEDEVKQVSHSAQASSSSSKSRDTYEAVLIFDERDDLSDGEGGHIRRKEADDSSVTAANKAADHVDENTATPTVTAPTETVAIAVADESPKATQDTTVSVAAEDDLHAKNIVVSSSVAEPIASSEPTIITKSEIAESEFDLAISVALPESDVESESIDEAPEVEPIPVPVPVPVPEPVPEPQQTSVFVLQEAANPEERSRVDQPSSSLSSLLSDDEEENQVRPRSIAIITETTPESVLSYQVPSPPLTPSSAPCYMASTATFVTPSAMISGDHNNNNNNNKNNDKQEADDHFDPEGKTSFESTTSTAIDEHHLASLLLTPRAEHPSPIATMVLQEKEVVAVEPRALEFGGVGEKASSTITVESTSQDESVTTTTTTTTDKKDEKPRALPEKYPNLVWSICKTTVVVSAAVVVLGL